jgi:hypothetical protein
MQTLLLVVAGLFAGESHADQSLKADAVLVYKSERLLMLLRAGEIIRRLRDLVRKDNSRRWN